MLAESHFAEYGVEPFATVRVPGIIRFFGFFAELYRGRTITGTSDSSLYISISPRNDQICNVFIPGTSDKRHFSVTTLKCRAEDKVVNYVKAVFKYFSYLKPSGFDITIGGELLEAGAFMLPAAIGTGLTTLFNKYYKQNLTQIQIAQKAYNAVNSFCGNTCFLSDTITMANAGIDGLISYSFKTGQLSLIGKTSEKAEDCLLKISAEFDKEVTEETVNDFIESIRETCKTMPMNFVEAGKTDFNSLIKTVPSELKETVEYILLEERMTQMAFDSCERKKFGMENQLLTKLYRYLSDNLDLFFPEYDWIEKRALEMCDCRGAGMVFDGIKPIILICIKKSAVEKFLSKVSEYEHIFGTSVKIDFYNPSNGVEIL